MQLSDIDYDLPEALIAQKPIEPRDSARLLVDVNQQGVRHLNVSDFDSLVGPGDVLVVNDTRVLPARIHLQRRTGGAAEVLLLEQLSDDHRQWEAMVKPARKLKEGEVLEYFGKRVVRIGTRTEAGDTFSIEILDEDPMGLLQRIGTMPLPPYIRGSLTDKERYQTIYSRRAASAAAPTAGLHFTPELMARIEAKGVKVCHVELIVGLDTFKPISTDDPLDHVIHTEYYNVPQEVLDTCAAAKRVIAVGTTATRALESAATRGELSGRTNLFITPGYEWKMVDAMLTNFHLPRTSLLLMVESFIGTKWRNLYAAAIEEKYRFLSFGDAMFIGREGK
ncbi:MAG: S-adenosylmethionine:tRNA ribosyltransferase-isomerase [Actinomycetota bacterium]